MKTFKQHINEKIEDVQYKEMYPAGSGINTTKGIYNPKNVNDIMSLLKKSSYDTVRFLIEPTSHEVICWEATFANHDQVATANNFDFNKCVLGSVAMYKGIGANTPMKYYFYIGVKSDNDLNLLYKHAPAFKKYVETYSPEMSIVRRSSFKEHIEEKKTSFTVPAYDAVYGYMGYDENDIDGLENPRTKEEISRFLSLSGGRLKFIVDTTENVLYMWKGINALHGQIASGLGLPAKNNTVRGSIERRKGKYYLYLSKPYMKNYESMASAKATNPFLLLLKDFQDADNIVYKETW